MASGEAIQGGGQNKKNKKKSKKNQANSKEETKGTLTSDSMLEKKE